jgi:nitrite reductase/ring-hydroxylating ferredoxin subunit
MNNDQLPPSTTHETDDSAVRSRRRALAVLAVAPAFAACALGTVDLPADNQDPENEGGANDDTGDPTQPPPGDDSGVSPTGDTGTPTTKPPTDSGTTTKPPTDSGTTSPADTGTPGTCTPTGTSAGAVSGWAVGSYKKVGTSYVGRDSGGFYALSSTCTHNNSCQLRTPTSTGISCPCHGAQFTVNGAVTKGPAAVALKNYKVSVCNGNVYVDQTKTVTSGTRAN